MFVHRKLGNRESFGDENVAARATLTFNNSLAFPREKRERERERYERHFCSFAASYAAAGY